MGIIALHKQNRRKRMKEASIYLGGVFFVYFIAHFVLEYFDYKRNYDNLILAAGAILWPLSIPLVIIVLGFIAAETGASWLFKKMKGKK
jgi:hypothetical protein